MALRRDIQGIVQDAMKLVKSFDLSSVITYYQVGNISYDPVTGLSTPALNVYNNLTAVLTTFSADEKTEDVAVITDRKALIAYNDLKIIPSNNDYFIDNKTGERWEVKKVIGFPGEPLHKIHVRKT